MEFTSHCSLNLEINVCTVLFCRWNYIMDVMDLIEKEAVLSPLQVT